MLKFYKYLISLTLVMMAFFETKAQNQQQVVDTAGFYINGTTMYVMPKTQLYVDGTIYNDSLNYKLGTKEIRKHGQIFNFDSIFFAGNINNRIIKKPLFKSAGIGTAIARYDFLQYIRNDTVNFNSLVINKFGQKLTLQRGITVNSKLNLKRGTVDFVHYNIDLLDTGSVVNETSDNYLKGDKGWLIARNRLVSPNDTGDVSSLGLFVTPEMDNLSLTTFYRRNDIQDSLSEGGIARLFDVYPGTGGSTNVKFNYFDNEWQGLRIPQKETAFKLWKSNEVGGDEAGKWVQDTSSRVDITINNVTSKNVEIKNSGSRLSVASFDCGTPPLLTLPDTTTWFCEGDSLVLDAGNNVINWQWSTGATTQKIKLKAQNITGFQDTIKVIGYNIKGCRNEKSVTVRVNPKPVAKFGTKVSACQNAPVLHTDSSTISQNQTLKYKWYFADTTYSTSQNPVKNYATLGTKNTKLVVASQYGCKDSVTKQIIINGLPKAEFQLSANQKCASEPVTFTNISYLTPGNIGTGLFKSQWDFNDGFTSNKQGSEVVDAEMKAYSKPGTYYIKLKVTSTGNCVDSVKKIFNVNPLPVAAFEVGSVITNKPTSFTNKSTISNFQPLNYTWDFGDGVGTSNSTNPDYTYTNSQAYTVKLITTSPNGCKDSVSQTITTSSIPVANFSFVPQNYCAGAKVDFTNSSTVDAGTLTYLWNFGDGTTNILTNPSKTYSLPGTYTVSLTATSNGGIANTITKVITVYPVPVAKFSGNNVCLGNVTTVTNASTISSGSMTYAWDLGNSTNSVNNSPQVTYSAIGDYAVTLITTSGFGCKDTANQTVAVNPNPVADFVVKNVCQGEATFLQNNSSISAGTLSYQWDLGNSTSSTETNPLFNYATYGTYNVVLKAVTNNGCSKQITKSVEVYPLPVPKFTASTACNKDTTYFTNQSTIASGTATYVWHFNATDSSTITNAKYVFANATLYNVELKAFSDKNCAANFTSPVVVRPLPTANFSASATCLGQTTKFTNQSTISAISTEAALTYTWNFGNNKQSVAPNPTQTYSLANTYNVNLKAESIYGCVGSVTKSVKVGTPPNPDFSLSNVCVGTALIITNNTISTDGTKSTYLWNFNDGTTATDSIPTKTYLIAKNYNIDLTATSAAGCAKTFSKGVNIFPAANLAFTLPAKTCVNQTVNINNTSSISSGTSTYSWDFGNSTQTSSFSPSVTYSSAADYVVTLSSTSNNGCTSTLKDTITVNPIPVVDFDIATIQGGLSFTNKSTISDLSTLNYVWNFGDGTSSSLTSPSHDYLNRGTYNVVLTATSSNTCKASTTKTTQYPFNDLVDFNYSSNTCEGTAIQFRDSSVFSNSNLSYSWDFGDGSNSTLKNPGKTYSSAGTYAVKLSVIPIVGNISSKTINVVINPKPVVDFAVNNICEKGNAIFTNNTTLGKTYLWSFGNGDTSSVQNPNKTYSKSGNYSITLNSKSDKGCENSLQKTLQVYAYPTVNIGDTINTCASSFPLDAKNIGSTYLWSTLETTQSITANTDGNYTLSVTNGGLCTTKDTVVVFLNRTSKINLGADRSLCYDEQIDAGPTGVTYLWNDNSTDRFLKIKQSGTYFVKIKDFGNCFAYDTVNITLKSGTPVNLGNDTTFCESNKNLVLDATKTNGSYLWNNGETTAQKTVFSSGIYGVSVSYPDGCKVYDEIKITINATPKVNLGNDLKACSSQLPLSLNASGTGLTYLWNDNSTNGTLAVNTSGLYFVKVKNASNCESTDSVNININNSPIVNLGNDTILCTGTSITLDAKNQGAVFQWSNGDANQTITASKGGNYSVQVTNAAGCKTTDAIVITEKTITPLDLGNNISLCANQVPYTLKANATYTTYNWVGGPTTTSYSVSNSGTYVLNVTDAFACKATDTIEFEVNTMPLVNLGADTSFCEGIKIKINAGNVGSNYLWSTTATTQAIEISKGGTYTVEVTTPKGCKGAGDKKLISYFSPKITLGNDQTLCQGQTVTFDAGNTGASFAWNNSETTQTINVNKTGKYTVKVTDANSCTAYDTVNATFESVPVPDLGADKLSCNPVVLDPSSAYSLREWSTRDTTRQITVNKTGLYFITFKTPVANCLATDSVKVTIYSFPKVNLGKDTTICENASLLLNAGNPGSGYIWNDFSTLSSLSVNKAGTYSVAVINTNNCISRDTIQIANKSITKFDLGNDQNLCEGSSTTLLGPAAASNEKYLWSDGSTKQLININQSGKYSLNFSNSNNCTSSDTVAITFHKFPVVKLGNDTTLCGNKLLNLGSANANFNILWNDNSTANQLLATSTGTYSVKVKNAYNCESADTISLTINPLPQLSLGADKNACFGDTVKIIATTNVQNLLWKTGETTPNLNITKAGEYSLKARTQAGCEKSDTIKVSFYKLPVINFQPDYTICANTSVTLDAGNVGSVYNWTSKKGINSSSQKLIANKADTIFVKVQNSDACVAKDTIKIYQSDKTVYANFLSVSSVTVGDTVSFINMSYPAPFTSKWNFGDDITTSTDTDPIHRYLVSGDINVTLTVNNGTCADTKKKTLKLARRGGAVIPDSLVNQEVFVFAKVYPNPNDGRFLFEAELLADFEMDIDMFDLNGKVIFSHSKTANKFQHLVVDETNIQTGVYILRAVVRDKVKMFRVVIAR